MKCGGGKWENFKGEMDKLKLDVVGISEIWLEEKGAF